MKRNVNLLIGLVMIFSLVLAACGTPTAEVIKETVVVESTKIVEGETIVETQIVEVIVTPEPEKKPVTLNYNFGTEPPSLDPSLATDTTSISVVGNLFVGLALLDPDTNVPLP